MQMSVPPHAHFDWRRYRRDRKIFKENNISERKRGGGEANTHVTQYTIIINK